MKITDWTQQPRLDSAAVPDFVGGQVCSARCLGRQASGDWSAESVADEIDFPDFEEPEEDDPQLWPEPAPQPLSSPLPRPLLQSTWSGTATSAAPVTVRASRGSQTASTGGSNSRTTVRPPAQEPPVQPTVQTGPAPAPATGKATLNLPPRPQGSMTGKDFIESTRHMNRTQREALILQEIQKGNVPDFARQMKEIQVSNTGPDGKQHTGTVRVMPDYLAIGSDQDFVRIPMDPITAQRIADQTGTSLPTTKMVDDVYRQADVKLKPQPLPPGAQMMSSDYYQRHNNLVEQQMASLGAQNGQLVAGNQKDLVISNLLTQHPDRVAIYGWHQPNGKPIQPLSTIHENTYADYSHGVRLVGGTMIVDGVERPVADVLRDPALAGLISKEGVIRDPRVPIR